MSVEDAKKAVEIGADAIMVSNHGGRQLDGLEFQEMAVAIDDTLDPREFLHPASPATWLRRFLNDLAITSGRSGEVHLLDSWARLSTVTEDILGLD